MRPGIPQVVALLLALSPAARAEDQPPAPATEAAKPEAQAKPDAPPPVPQNLENLAARDAEGILGKKVIGAAGEDMGLVVDVLVDRGGRTVAAVIDFGGFLGVGTRKIAIDWQLVQFRPDDRKKPVVLGLSRAALQSAPEYKPEQPIAIIGPPPAPPAPDTSPAPSSPDKSPAPPPPDTAPAPAPSPDGK